MSDSEFRVLLDGVSGVPVLADRREILRARIDRRRVRHRRVVASVVAVIAVGALGIVAIDVGGGPRNEIPASAYPIVSERATTLGDAVMVRSMGGDQILIEVAGIDAIGSTTDRPVAEYSMIDPPATSGFAVTGSTITNDEHDKPIVVVVIRVLDEAAHRMRATIDDAVGDEASASESVVVLVLRPTPDSDRYPVVHLEAIAADGSTLSTLDVFPFTRRPWSCATKTEFQTTIAAGSNPSREVAVPLVLIAPPLRVRCPGD
jgi:hypothetical protein